MHIRRRTLVISVGVLAAATASLAAMTMRIDDDLPVDTIDTESLWTVPRGLPQDIPYPQDNPFDRDVVTLGRKLFFDPILSRDRDRSCATCHQPDHGFATGDAKPPSLRGGMLERNAPSLFNRAFGKTQMWDGRFQTLEEQVLTPIPHEEEMGLPLDEAIDRLRSHESYPQMFTEAFDAPVSEQTLAKALASFVRRIFYGNTAMDRFREGKVLTMTTEERGGMWIFQSKGGCWKCHHGFNFTDEQFHNTGVGAVDGVPEPGRSTFTEDPADMGKFKTPTLRGLTLTAPYFHDGSAETLRDVIDFYNKGGEANSHLDEKMNELNLTEEEIDLLIAFLGSLSRQVEDDRREDSSSN